MDLPHRRGSEREPTAFGGLWLPLITPFLDGALDLASFTRLCETYATTGIRGLILLGTTGEGPTVTADERAALVARARAVLPAEMPILLGVSGNATAATVDTMAQVDQLDVDGYLLASPYYNRPPQDGLVAHFVEVCGATHRPIMLYNVPHRTGSNVANDTLLEVADSCPNVVAVKDSCGHLEQSVDLLRRAPDSLAILTGDDAQFFWTLAAGGAGGVLAAAHVATADFVRVQALMARQELEEARTLWFTRVAPLVPPLFDESNPMPLKHVLHRAGLISSAECRLPLTMVSPTATSALAPIVPRVPVSG